MNILEALEAQGIEYKINEEREGNIWLNCPYCLEQGYSQDTRFRFGLDLITGKANCFNCGRAFHDAGVAAITEKLELGDLEDIQQVIQNLKPKKHKVSLPDDYEVLRRPTQDDDIWFKRAYRYARLRGITKRQLQEHQIGITLTGDLAYRLIFPVYYKDKLRGLVGRKLTEQQEPKYKNSGGVKWLYNVPYPKGCYTAILVEGILDCLAVERALRGRPMDVIAMLGHSLTDHQLKMLRGYKDIMTWVDPDDAGVKGLFKLAPKLGGFKHYCIQPSSRDQLDPDELSTIEINRRIVEASLWSDSMAQSIQADFAFQE